LHYPEIGSRRLDSSTVKAILPALERSQERLVDLFAMGCLQSHDKIRALLAAETKLTAQEALTLGLIDIISLAA
jgi:ATP-dependent protease ClpP protease subunit